MLRRLAFVVLALLIAGGAAFWLLTMPRPLSAAVLPEGKGDPAKGELLFWAGGCASCHAAPGSKGDDRLKLAGGEAIASPFGTFHAPNISPDKTNGIGNWTTLDFVNAMKLGLGPQGQHLYPAFPYTSYQRMPIGDLVDLKAFLDTLPAVATANQPHELPFPFSVRRGVALWKLLYLDDQTFEPDPSKSDEINRGAYLVNGPGHCNECHTPRSAIGGLDRSRALAGAPDPSGKGTIPNITPGKGGIGDWSADEIANFLETGMTPDFDSVGGTMVEVQENMAKLPASDRAAIAAYLKDLAPIDSGT
ncbi:cytochrome C [Kaistia algarum]|uniref:c-type cytochrome n=1 Tax=Kaistia algarum TaxID=2083279 RepID=UPI000CE87390|nr:c-type cytochrome [Kaistia algarum]MCX5512186.1 c-type cytochrome [Kaistia algarum]PPE80284.1 cytochrome C [Kaistia algarum]